MPLIKKPVTGMKDILPEEMLLRDYLINIIKDTYRSYGFSSMETPSVEHIENLLSRQGGDNEKLIFRILKRGEKLSLADAEDETDLTDCGLRYDLTLPLARYYSNNTAVLPSPFKALQIGSVWRADRPQKGRFRQFTQCDIDILGEASNLAETELILATTTALRRICPENHFTVRINDRNILKAMASFSGFPKESESAVFITLDKMDKIGEDGVRAELCTSGFEEEAVDRYLGLFTGVSHDAEGVRELKKKLAGHIDEAVPESLAVIMDIVLQSSKNSFDLVFDPTLVRGMGYYTGTIFEVSMEGFPGSVAGGGRYDEMIGRFTSIPTPACGFSIGFERIMTILTDRGFVPDTGTSKKAILFEKGISSGDLAGIFARADELRKQGNDVMVARMNKNKKFQKEQLVKNGYTEFEEFRSPT